MLPVFPWEHINIFRVGGGLGYATSHPTPPISHKERKTLAPGNGAEVFRLCLRFSGVVQLEPVNPGFGECCVDEDSRPLGLKRQSVVGDDS